MRNWREWILTFFGAGLVPKAPGTVGSVAAALGVVILHLAVSANVSFFTWNLILLICALTASAGMVFLGPWAVQHYGTKDPQRVVLDEAAAIFVTMIFLPIVPGTRGLWTVLMALLAFRLFDITKPPPCRNLEKLPHGWGILSDDLMAGVYANLLCQLATRWLL